MNSFNIVEMTSLMTFRKKKKKLKTKNLFLYIKYIKQNKNVTFDFMSNHNYLYYSNYSEHDKNWNQNDWYPPRNKHITCKTKQ